MKRLVRVAAVAFEALTLVVSSAFAQDPHTVAQWSPVMFWPWMAVHAQVLPTGKVLYWPQFADGDNPTLWDPPTPQAFQRSH
jgi:hypothetical protein